MLNLNAQQRLQSFACLSVIAKQGKDRVKISNEVKTLYVGQSKSNNLHFII